MTFGAVFPRVFRPAFGPGLAVSGITPFDFNASLATFTPRMGKRSAPGPFAAAPIVQGDGNNADALTDDVLSLGRGTQISGNFYPQFDGGQGALVLWWTPEFAYSKFSGAGDHFIWYASANYFLAYEYDNDRYNLTIGGQSMTVAANIAAGTTYCLAVRWNCANTLDGTNYACLSINDSHTFGITTQPTAAAADATIYVGGNGTTGAASGIIEGNTIYRRPLYDGAYGVDVGNGDELAAIYASGAGKDPTEVTGSWDVCICIPTNSSAGALVTGTGEAWSHPHSSNVLTDGFCQTTYGSSAWSTKGSPSVAPDDLATADKIFNWGYDWTCSADTEGVTQSKTSLTAGQDYVIRAIAHVSDANDLRIRVTDDTNAADIVTFAFGASSTRAAPGVGIFTFELPTIARNGVGSDCTAITIAVEGTAASQQVYLHQLELLNNLIDNPSMETGSGDPWIPDGFTNEDLITGDSSQELAVIHSGSSSFRANQNINYRSIGTIPSTTSNLFYSGGLYIYSDGTTSIPLRSINLNNNNGTTSARPANSTAAWKLLQTVYKAIASTGGFRLRFEGITASDNRYADDAFLIPLTPVSLTVTPASQANSAETSGLRVDGLDTCTQPITNLTATEGQIRFKWTPRHSKSSAGKFGQNNTKERLLLLWGDANNYIYAAYHLSAQTTLAVNSNGAGEHQDCDTAFTFSADTTYNVVIEYTATGITMTIDDVEICSISTAVNFTTSLAIAYWGTQAGGAEQADATFAAPA